MHRTLRLIALPLLLAASAAAQDWTVYPGLATDEATGVTHRVGDSRSSLAYALERSDTAGAVIECNGKLSGVRIAIGENYRRTEVVRADPLRVTLVAGPDHVSIGGIAWGDKKKAGGLPGLAVEHLGLDGITIDGRFSQSPLAGFMDTRYGDIVFDNVTVLSTPSQTKWGSRGMGQARNVTITGCAMLGGGQEHAWYWDNPTGSFTFSDNIAMGWRRTMLQVVTRKTPGSPGLHPPAALGDLLIERNEARDCGRDGAHNFTVAGWPNGTVRFKGNRGESKWPTGLFISYPDWKQGDLLTTDGFQTGNLVLMDNQGIYPHADRDMVGLGGIRHVEIRGGDLSFGFKTGNKSAYDLEWNGDRNGSVVLESRDTPNEWPLYTGQAPFRANRVALPPSAVDALWSGSRE